MYKIYEFEDASIEAIPISWVNDNMVKWHKQQSYKYAKRNMPPKADWKQYVVKPILSRVFGSHEETENAVKKILELNKSDLDSDDFHFSSQYDAASQLQSTNHKRNRCNIDYAKLAGRNFHLKVKGNEKHSDDDDTDSDEILENIIFDPMNVVTMNIPKTHDDGKVNGTVESSSVIEACGDATGVSGTRDVGVIDDAGLNYNKDVDVTIMEHQMIIPIITFNELVSKVNEIQNSLDRLLKIDRNNLISHSIRSPEGDMFNKLLPFENIDDLLKFEDDLLKDETKVQFANFLRSIIPHPTTLRVITGALINKVYSFQFQEKINYTGVKNKLRLKNLLSTNIILELISENALEFINNKDKLDCWFKAKNEFLYYLQHYYDRKRSKKYNNNISANNNTTEKE